MVKPTIGRKTKENKLERTKIKEEEDLDLDTQAKYEIALMKYERAERNSLMKKYWEKKLAEMEKEMERV